MTRVRVKCVRPNCDRIAIRQKLCKAHYQTALKGDVDATAVRERIALLRGRGYSLKELAAVTGLTPNGLLLTSPSVRAGNAARIMAIPVPDNITDLGGRIPSAGTHRRIRALMAIGYPQRDLADRLGVDRRNMSRYFHRTKVAASFASRVEDLFNELQMIPGPSDRARRWAQAKGWPVPFSWDEDSIDNPLEQPAAPVEASVSWLEKYTELRDLGVPESRIPERMGIDAKSVERQLIRLGLFKGAA